MNILSIVILLFAILESSNILMLYFFPESSKGNSTGVFNAYEKSKSDSEVHDLVNYLINWVAGTKLIFIFLLIVILIFGNDLTILYSVVALIFSVLSFYWRLFPAIKKMDKADQITPKGYSKTLGLMIAVFIAIFSIALTVHYLYL